VIPAHTAHASFQRLAVVAGAIAAFRAIAAGVVTSLVADLVTGLLGDARSVCVKRTPFGIDPFRRQARDMVDVFSRGGPPTARKVFGNRMGETGVRVRRRARASSSEVDRLNRG